MTSRPRSAARRPGLPVAQLDSALMPLGDRERGEPIAETEATRFKCSLERGLQLISGRSAVAASAAMRRSRRSGGDGCSCESCLQRAGGSSQSRAPRFRAFPGLSLAGRDARAETEAGRGRSGEDVKLCALLQAGLDVDAVTHAGDHVLQQMRRPGRRWRPGSAREPAPPVRTQGCMCCQRSSSSTVLSRCRDPRTAPSRECTRIRSDTTVEVDAAARWRDQLAVIARARARHVPGARHRRPTITAMTTHRTQPATLSPPPLTVVWPPTALTVTPPCSSESPPQ